MKYLHVNNILSLNILYRLFISFRIAYNSYRHIAHDDDDGDDEDDVQTVLVALFDSQYCRFVKPFPN